MKILTSALVAGLLAAGAVQAAEIDFSASEFASTFPSFGDVSTAVVTVDGVTFTVTADARGTDGFRQSFDSAGLSFGLPGNGMYAIAISADQDVTYTALTGEDRSLSNFSTPQLFNLLTDGVFRQEDLSFGTSFATLDIPDISVGAGEVFTIAADFAATAGYDPIYAQFVLGSLSFDTAQDPVDPVDPVAPVPLPAGLPLLLAGLGAIGIAQRRKG